MESGENEWTNGIHSQIKRLSQLIGNFVSLSKMDEEESKLEKTDFCLSDSVSDIASSFLLTASSKNKELKLDIEENIHYFGNEEALRRLVSILLDNAINYSSDNSTVTLSLTSQGRKIILQTKNLSDNLKKGNYDILFERFYRCDSSRNSLSGGHGIGLSIARAIESKHKGKITAISPDGKCIIFTLIL